ncbi:hypothetical protein [Emticicia soli]|uniref:Uncharacterized protein n=1 Tax=Emticicia soli TaxID=2027878 RepID=A0ABW5J5V7_9BACT
MSQSDDIDLMLTLNPDGWSTCILLINGRIIETFITHVFGDPYYDLIRAIIDLLKGQETVTLFWFSEPGGEKIEITRHKTQQHKVNVTINGFSESWSKSPKELHLIVAFEIQFKQLISLFYFQLKKTSLLMQEKDFAKARDYFPYKDFYELESLIKEYLNV